MGNVEYVGWVEEIIGVDCGKFEILLLYNTWVQAITSGHQATMKQDEYGFTLVRFDQHFPYSANSFAFPIHVQQVFFADDISNPGWKVVLQKERRGTTVASKSDSIPNCSVFVQAPMQNISG